MEAVALIPAERWNALALTHRRSRSRSGLRIALGHSPDGTSISADVGAREPRHAWQISAHWRDDPAIKPLGGVWVATVHPGFVNGRDVTIPVERPKKGGGTELIDIALIDEDPPELPLDGFRDPARSSSFRFDEDGRLHRGAAEGYPEAFDALGVVNADQGSDALSTAAPDPTRTRQIRAIDVVLVTPRLGTAQKIELKNPGTDAQSVEISNTFQTATLARAQERGTHHWIYAISKYSPAPEPTALDRLLGEAVEPQTDEIRLSTVYLVSPADVADPAAPPDATWSAYPAHEIFYSLNHASIADVGGIPEPPIVLRTGLAFGVGDALINSLLSPLNDFFSHVFAWLRASSYKGRYWST